MRATRGLFASLGAGLSLILAGTAALTFVSALIAFDGWPGVSTERTADERAIVAEVAAQRTPVAAPARITLPPAPRPVATVKAVAARPVKRARPAAAAARRPARTTASRDTAAATHQAAAAPAPPAVTPPPPAAPAAKSRPLQASVSLAPVGETVKDLGTSLAATVTTAGDTLGGLVQPVLPAVSKAAQDATKALGYVIASLAAAAAQSAAPVTQTTPTVTVPVDPAAVVPTTGATTPTVPATPVTP